ncbi:hypothetical protein ACFWG3_09495 [Rhodococcus aetherivorans]|uniref:hypothetical protein n=1 Tax=Rhodococcus aetherivorans TaxID=191292 RepID=UPI0036690ABB
MAAYIRKVRTASGAMAVQIAAKQGRRDKVLEHLGSAHTDSELAALLDTAREKLLAGQQELDLDLGTTSSGPPTITGKRSRWLIEVLEAAWRRLGFEVVDNEAFFQLVAARIVEPTSVADAGRVLREIGIAPGPPQHLRADPAAVHRPRLPRRHRTTLLRARRHRAGI